MVAETAGTVTGAEVIGVAMGALIGLRLVLRGELLPRPLALGVVQLRDDQCRPPRQGDIEDVPGVGVGAILRLMSHRLVTDLRHPR